MTIPKCPLCAVDQDMTNDDFNKNYPDLLKSRPDLIAEKLCDNHLNESKGSLEYAIENYQNENIFYDVHDYWEFNLKAINHEILKRKAV